MQPVPDNYLRSSETAEQYMALSIGRTTLMTPLDSIASIDNLQHLDSSKPDNHSIGWILHKEQKTPVYSITDDLDFEQSVSAGKSACAVLSDHSRTIAVICDEVSLFKEDIIQVQALPGCMQTMTSPVDSLCIYRSNGADCVNFITSIDSLVRYIECISA